MRRSFINELEQQANSQRSKPVVELELKNNTIDQLDRKAKWHTRNHPDFNINFAGGYTRPTTPGTKPVNRTDLLTDVRDTILDMIVRELRTRKLL